MIYKYDGKTPTIGEGTYVAETAVIIGDVTVGKGCYIGAGAIIRGDYGKIIIGDETAVEEGVIIHAPPGQVGTVGKRVTLGHGCIVHSTLIEDFVVVGMGAVVSIGAKVGQWAIVAEGAVVKQNQSLPGKFVYTGTPARATREVLDRDVEYWSGGKQLYADLAAKNNTPGMIEKIG